MDEPPQYDAHRHMSQPSWEEFGHEVLVDVDRVKEVGVWMVKDPPSFEAAKKLPVVGSSSSLGSTSRGQTSHS